MLYLWDKPNEERLLYLGAEKGPQAGDVISLDVEESEDIVRTCTKCGKGRVHGADELVRCHDCRKILHKLCHWSSINIATPNEVTLGINHVVYLCTQLCWISKGFSSSHVPAAPADV